MFKYFLMERKTWCYAMVLAALFVIPLEDCWLLIWTVLLVPVIAWVRLAFG